MGMSHWEDGSSFPRNELYHLEGIFCHFREIVGINYASREMSHRGRL